MKKFILKTALFVAPFALLSLFSLIFYSAENGDLFRIGYIFKNSSVDKRTVFANEFLRKMSFTNVSELNLEKKNDFTVFTIGDSFSDQGNIGYQDYLAEITKAKVLNLDRFLTENIIEALYGVINGDMLDSLHVKYIVLQSVERDFAVRGKNLDTNYVIRTNELSQQIKKHKKSKKKEEAENDFFSRKIFRVPLYNIYYNFDDNAYYSQTYRVKTTKNLFSANDSQLFFFDSDLEYTKINNDKKIVANLSAQLNKLSRKLKQKGITLIVLPSPDKFDFYYEYIVEQSKYPKPLFFDYLEMQPKEYVYINTKQLLKAEMQRTKDIYFYDDTHWSPHASKAVAAELAKFITP